MPPPLQIPPSRARRQFAARLAQRKLEFEASQQADNAEDGDDSLSDPSALANPDDDENEKQKDGSRAKEPHERFTGIFEGIEDDSSSNDGSDDLDPEMERREREGALVA
ncbi:hypothetical protein BU24DRAFT_403620 [Aaosphaeria arxii CBS 175.79]|uniref:Uncharacterized protein n=1 Tax=Aaosphaeria arxii CBS 175.79 TaxID=1450172 RepID=A0A6A5Y5G1_9PLEO|nr:uncharacterized protein BU24DRAFT_403620 [Aaosphaeria arxii CBS 175.79]KAF2020516.1 hypothetical protein BU24DRAFT_403620 [Aaosphaeria arxii CBS 175.79]